MTVRMGKSGRVTIPKKLRDELGLSPGSTLVLIVQEDRFVLEPIPAGKLVRQKGVLVWDGPVPTDIGQKLRQQRTKRMRDSFGR